MSKSINDYALFPGTSVAELSAFLRSRGYVPPSPEKPLSNEMEDCIVQYLTEKDEAKTAATDTERVTQEFRWIPHNPEAEGTTRYDLAANSILLLASDALFKPGLPALLSIVLDMQRLRQPTPRVCITSRFEELLREPPMIKGCEQEAARRVQHLFQQMEVGMCKTQSADDSELDSICRFIYSNATAEHSVLLLSGDQRLRMMLYAERYNGNIFHVMDLTADGYLTDPSELPPLFQHPSAARKGMEDTGEFIGEQPQQGSFVRADDGKFYILGDRLGQPGESGIVYAVNDQYCVKIFYPFANTGTRLRRTRALCAAWYKMYDLDPLMASRIAFPQQIVYNRESKPVGYLMQSFRYLHSLEWCRFKHDVRTIRNLVPRFSRLHQLRMAMSLAQVVSFAERNHLILGEVLSSSHILFDQEMNAHLIGLDHAGFTLDSLLYQADNQSTLEEILPPERIGQEDKRFRKTEADDVWALQIQLFRILMCSAPYERSDQTDQAALLQRGDYPYQSGTSEYALGVKDKACYDRMSHLPAFLREAFFEAFYGSGKHFLRTDRIRCEEWLQLCIRYYQLLAKLAANDKESLAALPSHRRVSRLAEED